MSQSDNPRADQKRGIRITAGVAALMALLFVGAFFYSFTREHVPSIEQLQEAGLFLFDNPRALPEFTLVDDQGREFTPESLKGQWNLLFFGFTYCPDICPTTMATLNNFYKNLDPQIKRDTRVLLVSVDPGRDTPEQLNEYLGFFNPAFRGVTGEFLDIHRFATGVNVPFTRVPGDDENYLIDHGGNIVLINAKGHYVGFIRMPITEERLESLYPAARLKRSG